MLELQKHGFRQFRETGKPEFRNSGYSGSRGSGISEHELHGPPDIRGLVLPAPWKNGLQGSQESGEGGRLRNG